MKPHHPSALWLRIALGTLCACSNAKPSPTDQSGNDTPAAPAIAAVPVKTAKGPDQTTPGRTSTPADEAGGSSDVERDALIAKIVAAAAATRFDDLERLMDDEFYATGPMDDGEYTKEFALARWKAAPEHLTRLVELLSGPCGASESNWICPRSVAGLDDEGGDAEYVLFEPTDDGWRWTTFISGGSAGPSANDMQRAQASTNINRGRQLSRKGDLAGAVAAFEAALKIDPDSATAACEAGYAELRQDHLAAAQHHLEHGLQLALTPEKEAACEFNLGLVQEKRGKTERALGHFKRSLALRDSKAVRARIAKLAPTGACLPPHRPLDLKKESCGLPDDYWECGVHHAGGDTIEGSFTLLDDLADPEPIAPGLRLRVAGIAFGERKTKVDLFAERNGQLLLIATLGWSIKTDFEQSIDTVSYAHLDLVPGEPTEVVVTVTATIDESGSFAVDEACGAKFGEGTPAFAECVDERSKPVQLTTYFGCGEIEGRWVCGHAKTKPTTQAQFMALFACK